MATIEILDLNIFNNQNLGKGLYVNNIKDHLRESHRHINRPHKHDFYSVIFFTAGSGTHDIDFTSFTVRPGSIFFLSPGQSHSWKLSDDVEGYVAFHSGEFYNAHFAELSIDDFMFFGYNNNNQHIVLDAAAQILVSSTFSSIIEEKNNKFIKSKSMLLSHLTFVYITSERSIESPDSYIRSSNSYLIIYDRFRKLLEKHYTEEKSPQQYADWSNVSAKHLNRINKALVGKSSSEIITDRVILEAKRMMVHTRLNFSEVAAELGFDDYSYFSKVFRKHTGVNPKQFVSKYA